MGFNLEMVLSWFLVGLYVKYELKVMSMVNLIIYIENIFDYD